MAASPRFRFLGACVAVTLGLLTATVAAQAAAPRPPVLLCAGGAACGGASGTPPLFETGRVAPSGSLGSLPAFVTARWPAAPDVLSREPFTQDTDGDGRNDAQLWTGNGGPCMWNHCWQTETMNGRRMVINPGTYHDDLVVDCTDCEVDASRGVTIVGDLVFGPGGNRISWHGGTVLGAVRNLGSSNLLIDDVHAANPAPDAANQGDWGTHDWERVAIVNSTLEATGTAPEPGQGGWVLSTGSAARQQHLILANVRMEHRDGGVLRLQSVADVILYRFVLNGNLTATQALSLGQGNSAVSMADGLVFGPGASGGDVALRQARIQGVTRVQAGTGHWSALLRQVESTTVVGSDCYTSSQMTGTCPIGDAGTSGSGNRYLGWDGTSPLQRTTDGNFTDFRVGADH